MSGIMRGVTRRIPFDATIDDPGQWQRLDWLLLQNSNVHQCSDGGNLAVAMAALGALGYRVLRADAGMWQDTNDMHDALASTLDFPDDCGRNLDALDDVLQDVAMFERGSDVAATGTVLGLAGYQNFMSREPETAHAFLDIWANEARMALIVDHPMILLVEASVPFDKRVGGTPVMQLRPQWIERA